MIRGLGTDVVDVERIRSAYARFEDKLAARILSPAEQTMMRGWNPHRQVEFLAGRFAAKEAMAKACGIGLGRLQMNCVDIRVGNQGLIVTFCPEATNSVHTTGRWHVSISHTSSVAYAVALWENDLGLGLGNA